MGWLKKSTGPAEASISAWPASEGAPPQASLWPGAERKGCVCEHHSVLPRAPHPPEKDPLQPTNSRLPCRPASQRVPHGSWAEGTQAEALQWK